MDLGGSGDLRVLVRRFMWVVWAWIWGFRWSSCIGAPVHVGGLGMDLGSSSDLRVLVCRFLWVVWAWIWGVHCFFCRRRVCNSWTQDSSLLVKGSSQRGYSYTMGASPQVLRRRVSNRWPVNNRLKDQQYHYQCSDSEITGCIRNTIQ